MRARGAGGLHATAALDFGGSLADGGAGISPDPAFAHEMPPPSPVRGADFVIEPVVVGTAGGTGGKRKSAAIL